ncbi:polyamine ABC transporter substrate-binding protein [Nocardioides euryhalodurans]|uniref:Spermidine/putrescine ABC transporter substrate-binding protein n=1 Tax=Nocardioides euryhalodurans TaxID=2518370 RepID=A0A4P7GPD6_9ACTN|nr:spermidine/putrescine ABC transporter substrate-binding protein [Nocardioides euryhalodurans]QBR94108.1 spermidine/putrescine ABC transporter substrate-binding protein [Nocardioides euryhalodurans]
MSRQPALTRRSLLQGVGIGAAVVGSALVLPRFSVPGAQQDPAQCRAEDLSESQKQLIISNWPAYIDPRRQPESTLNVFQERTGVTVDYTDDVNDNAEFFAKVRNQLGACEPIDRDMMMLTDWMAARMIGLGWIQPIAKDKVPNLHANLIEPLRGRQWDPDRQYSAPWQSGLTGIAYNAAETGEVKSFSELLTRTELKGRVTLLSEMRDTMGFMLRIVGADPGDFTPDEWADAIEELRKAVAAEQIRAFTGNEYIQDLTAGNIAACEAWSGDVIQAQFENPDIRFVVPEEGLSLWSDNMIVPNMAEHQANAEAWIDYYYEPEVAAKLAAWVNYICPVEGAREEMEKIDPSLVDNKLIFPSAEDLADTFDFMPLDDQLTAQYEGEWSDVTGG